MRYFAHKGCGSLPLNSSMLADDEFILVASQRNGKGFVFRRDML